MSLNQQGATPFKPQGYIQAPTYNPNTVASAPTITHPQPPALPVKKHETVDSAGNKTTQTFDTTQKTSATPTSSPGTYKGVLINPGNDASVASQIAAIDAKNQPQTNTVSQTNTGTPPPPATSPVTASSAPNTPTYGGLIGAGATASQNAINTGSNNLATANKGLLDIAQGNNPNIQADIQKINEIKKSMANTPGEIAANPNALQPISDARSAITSNAQNAQLSAAEAGLANEYTGQGQQISAGSTVLGGANTTQGQGISGLGSNAGMLSPVTTPALFNPINGQPINPQLLGNAIKTANDLVNNGTPISDPTVQSLLSPYGFVGTQALVNAQQAASGGGFNPAAQNATANQNISQGTQYQGAATDLDTGLKQLDNVSSLATNFLNTNKLLNPSDNPDYNAGINTYVGKFKNPADKLNYEMIMGDIAKFQSQILASNNGQIPTAITNQLASFDPHNLSAAQLMPYLQTLKQLGGNQLSVLQGQSSSSLNSGAKPYAGSPTQTSTTPISAPAETSVGGSQVNNPILQAAIGNIMNIGGGIWNSVTGLAAHLFGQ